MIQILLFLSFASANTDSFKYEDLTLKKWTKKEDPQLAINDMTISVGNKMFREKDRFTGATWKVSGKSSCPRYTINFQIEDRAGKVIVRESKKFVYNGRGDTDEFNKDFSNVTNEGRDHFARFNARFHDRNYLTVKYWISGLECKADKLKPHQNGDPRKAFTIEDQLRLLEESD